MTEETPDQQIAKTLKGMMDAEKLRNAAQSDLNMHDGHVTGCEEYLNMLFQKLMHAERGDEVPGVSYHAAIFDRDEVAHACLHFNLGMNGSIEVYAETSESSVRAAARRGWAAARAMTAGELLAPVLPSKVKKASPVEEHDDVETSKQEPAPAPLKRVWP